MTLIGLAGEADDTTARADAKRWLGLSSLPIQQQYLNQNIGWSSGMISDKYILQCSSAGKAIIDVPILVGSQIGSNVNNSGTGRTMSPQDHSGANSPTEMNLTDVANGKWDLLFEKVFATIAKVRPDCILRIGSENWLNGVYAWQGKAMALPLAAAYRHVVSVARSISPNFKFDWNGASTSYSEGYDTMKVAGAYPGDDVVDYITFDCYDQYGTYGKTGWADQQRDVLNAGLTFARNHGKLYGFSEFGVAPKSQYGAGDDPNWVMAGYNWLHANRSHIGYVLYFNANSWSGRLNNNPNSASIFSRYFGSWARNG